MTTQNNIAGARRGALDQIDRAERGFKLTFVLAAVVEAFFLGGFLLLADFSNRLHLLLLVASVATYTIVILGLIALGTHVTRCTLRVLKAVGARD
ncbi:MAG TPA: hypothetical protein VM864_08150 [Pyrinomonadaceae bacterium]|jgi:hypothetical protein|nr:hypothetical protein [Pyrinomonadaceae bacterium]